MIEWICAPAPPPSRSPRRCSPSGATSEGSPRSTTRRTGRVVSEGAQRPGPAGPATSPATSTGPEDTTLYQPTSVDLTVVVPFYNPGPAVGTMLGEALTHLRDLGSSFEIVAKGFPATQFLSWLRSSSVTWADHFSVAFW